ncbi:MAG: SCO family protein [Gammaproteobacteria bacterium]|jgi:protein SCO1/2|nr:SCO family protein [Gammaproteobacteria bacterium]MDH3846735.1 SCO family protein [Gammaproteobacteria bacterium]MDH3904733.1 SCO family protein [Gammaproteobacteria bacterium]MDH4005105.1 SCO family protein [Gammaproteobacteria bacterium]
MMRLIGRTLITSLLTLVLTIPAGAIADEDPHAKHRAMMKQKSEPALESADVDLRDRPLLTQDGEEVLFVSDVIGDNIVVMDFVYTTCTTICPVLSAIFTQVQGKLGEQVGDDVVLVSMSVDPIRDTPQRLKAYSAKHRAGDSWLWLTGAKPVVDEVLVGVGAYTTNFEDHPTMVLIGDGRTGEWKRLFGFPNPDRIVSVVNEMRARRESGG